MNVALTRAKSSLFILGNAPTLERSNSDWKEIVNDARTRSLLSDVSYEQPREPRVYDFVSQSGGHVLLHRAYSCTVSSSCLANQGQQTAVYPKASRANRPCHPSENGRIRACKTPIAKHSILSDCPHFRSNHCGTKRSFSATPATEETAC